MNIQEEVKKTEHIPMAMCNSEMAELYKAVCERWKLQERSLVVTASMFYGLGWMHGIRHERQRHKGRNKK